MRRGARRLAFGALSAALGLALRAVNAGLRLQRRLAERWGLTVRW